MALRFNNEKPKRGELWLLCVHTCGFVRLRVNGHFFGKWYWCVAPFGAGSWLPWLESLDEFVERIEEAK